MICAKILFLLKFLDSITRSDVCKSLLIGMLLAGPSLGAEPGVTDQEIRIGMSAAFSGPTQDLGLQFKLGAQACFSQVNKSGGIAGRKIRLITYDDQYEPDQTVANTRRLIDGSGLFFVRLCWNADDEGGRNTDRGG
jgi:ABC-type branched-subunit amino acid transport system substrate-binding protein